MRNDRGAARHGSISRGGPVPCVGIAGEAGDRGQGRGYGGTASQRIGAKAPEGRIYCISNSPRGVKFACGVLRGCNKGGREGEGEGVLRECERLREERGEARQEGPRTHLALRHQHR